MARPQFPILAATRIRVMGIALLALTGPVAQTQAQVFGYGGFGYPGYGYGYGYGFPPVGYYGYGGAVGFGLGNGYGYPGMSYAYFGNAYQGGPTPYVDPIGNSNPLMGLGLTPLGVQSAQAEAALINAARPRRPGPASTQAQAPVLPPAPAVPGSVRGPGQSAADIYSGTGSARPR